MIKRAVALVVVAAILVTALFWSQRDRGPYKVSGFVEAHEIRLGSLVGGRVAEVLVEEGQKVESSQTLVRLEPFDLEHRLAGAQAELAACREELRRLETGFRPQEVAQAQARVAQLQARLDRLDAGPRSQEIGAAKHRVEMALAQLELAQQAFARSRETFQRGATTQDALDRAVEQLKAAQANNAVREKELELLEEGTRAEELAEARAQLEEARQAHALMVAGYRDEEKAKAQAACDAANGAVEAIERQIEELEVKTPAAGVVEAIELRPGDLVVARSAMLSIMDTSTLWVRAYMPENRLALQTGQPVWVSVDSFPGRKFAAEVTFVSRQAEFTPSNVQTPEERSKQVFRVKVTLREGLDELRPGMAADVWLEDE